MLLPLIELAFRRVSQPLLGSDVYERLDVLINQILLVILIDDGIKWTESKACSHDHVKVFYLIPSSPAY